MESNGENQAEVAEGHAGGQGTVQESRASSAAPPEAASPPADGDVAEPSEAPAPPGDSEAALPRAEGVERGVSELGGASGAVSMKRWADVVS